TNKPKGSPTAMKGEIRRSPKSSPTPGISVTDTSKNISATSGGSEYINIEREMANVAVALGNLSESDDSLSSNDSENEHSNSALGDLTQRTMDIRIM
ncbi:hypothetical protein SARC_09729, partial [Sphaeroforma arctica JP610]